jgi:galactokinase
LVSAPRVVIDAFKKQFGPEATPRIFRAPGRVNLIGEHTDYNLGFVLPIALERACYVAIASSADGMFRVWSENEHEQKEWPAADLGSLKPADHWSDYVVGVAQQLLQRGYEVGGANLAIHSTVPVGAGLSSSAAIEVSSALAILCGREIDKTELARLCQAAEINFVGMPCGIMDQYVSVFGEANHAIRIDCRTVTHTSVPLPSKMIIVAVNSMVKHELGSSAYRERVRECSEAVEIIRRTYPDVQALRDVSSQQVNGLKGVLPEIPFRRARHVTTEDERVEAFMRASSSGDLHQMGRLFVQSHRSLQYDYEVSAPELDFLVDTAIELPGVYGARMTGGGFGGCTVNLVDPAKIEDFEGAITAAYSKAYGIVADRFRCTPAEGAREITE